MDIIKITNEFQGYIWMSDEAVPHVYDFDTESELILDPDKNPFINEGLLYDTKSNISYSIKYIDGKYIIRKTQVLLPYDISDTFVFHSHGIGKRLRFIAEWKEYNDPLCENMPVKCFSDYIFIGFNN